MISVAADGSCLGNPGPGGWAWYVNENCWRAGGWAQATNNQGELQAVLDLLESTRDFADDLMILCDSQYVINALTTWRHAWKRKSWRKSDGEAVKNQDLLKALDQALEDPQRAGKVEFKWVKGHAGHPLNEAADSRARAVAVAFQDTGKITEEMSGPGWNYSVSPKAPAPKSLGNRLPEPHIPGQKEKLSAGDKNSKDPRFEGLFAGFIGTEYANDLPGNSEYPQMPTFGMDQLHQQGKYQVKEHWLEVPLDHFQKSSANQPMITIFAREITAAGGEEFPYLVFFQGGPGCPGNRSTDWGSGWTGEVLKHFRLIMLDQRGTGYSTPLDNVTIPALATDANDWLSKMRADQIVEDAEAFRKYLGIREWTVMGQSYGGFIITCYLSRYQRQITRAFITGGLPGLVSLDQIYQQTYHKTALACDRAYREVPGLEAMIRQVAVHLEGEAEYLPSGEQLSALRLRSIGMNLGRTQGLGVLRELFTAPFVQIGTQKRLTQDFLAAVETEISFARNPLYIVLHETIYANAFPGAGITRWAADRVREEIPGFSAQADPRDRSTPYYLTGEHFGKWTLQADPALQKLLPYADYLANKTDWGQLYDLEALQENKVPVYACVYRDDIFVPRELSMDTAQMIKAVVRPNADYQHDGLRASGTKVIADLLQTAMENERWT